MSAKWGVTEWRNRSVSRLEEQRGWLGGVQRDPGDQDGPWRDEPTRQEQADMDAMEDLSRHADTPAGPDHNPVIRTRSGRVFGDRELTLEFRGDCSCGHVGIWLMTEIRARAAWARHVERATSTEREAA